MRMGDIAVRFEWDAGNRRHIVRHRVRTVEAEHSMQDRNAVNGDAYWRPGEWRDAIIGMTSGGRLLFVVCTMRDAEDGTEVIRVVTARDATRWEQRQYEAGM